MDFKTLNLLYRCSREFGHEKIRMRDLSETECMICTYVYENGDCSQDDVSVGLKIDKTTVGKALDSLERKNCILRRKSETDKRKNILRLTEHGVERISDLMNIHNEWLEQIMGCLEPEEQIKFENYCSRLLIAAEQLTKNHGGNTLAQ